MLWRFDVVFLSLLCCTAIIACIVGFSPRSGDEPDGKFVDPPELESVWQTDVNGNLKSGNAQARIDGGELFVWGQFSDDSDDGDSADGDARFTSLDLASGEKRWESEPNVTDAWIAEDAIVVKYVDKVQVLERNDGSVRFEVDASEDDYSVGATADGLAVIVEKDDRHHLVFYDLDSGDKRWSKRVEDKKSPSAMPVAVTVPTRSANVDGPWTSGRHVRLQFVQEAPLVFASVQRMQDGLIWAAYSVEDGDQLGKIDLVGARFDSRGAFMTLTPQGNTVATVGGGNCEQSFVSVDAKAEKQAEFTLRGGPTCDDDRKAIHQNFVDGKLYGLDEDGHPQLVDPDTGGAVWAADEPGQPLTFADGTATYAVESKTEVKAVEVASGENVWSWDYGLMNLGHDRKKLQAYATPLGSRYGGEGDHMLLGGPFGSFGLDTRSGERLWASSGVVEEFNDEYVVLVLGVGTEQQLQVSQVAG